MGFGFSVGLGSIISRVLQMILPLILSHLMYEALQSFILTIFLHHHEIEIIVRPVRRGKIRTAYVIIGFFNDPVVQVVELQLEDLVVNGICKGYSDRPQSFP